MNQHRMSGAAAGEGLMIWRVVAVALFGVASISGPVAATCAAVLASGALWLSFVRPDLNASPAVARLVTAALALTLVLVGSQLGSYGSPEPAGPAAALWVSGAVTAAVLTAWPRSRMRAMGTVLAALLIGALAVGTVVQFHGNLFGLDIYRAHEAAADALRAGENPYTDAVRVLDGSPNAEEGGVIEGYPYPPVTLVLFSLGDWLGGDPRWATVLAIVAGLGLAWGPSNRNEHTNSIVVLLAATPTLRWIIWSGATEPVTFLLLIVVAVVWRRPVMSGVVLGLALATKQYLVVLVPLVFLIDDRPWRRSWISLGVAGATLLPAFLADPGPFWHTMIERPMSLGFRPDTQSIAGALNRFGMTVDVPTIVMVVGAIIVAWAFVRSLRRRTPAALLSGTAIVLAVVFLLSLAFTNYWWLVQWLAAGACLFAVDQRQAANGDRLSPVDAV